MTATQQTLALISLGLGVAAFALLVIGLCLAARRAR